MTRTVAGMNVLVTGANRGLGRALVDDALRRGAARVYAAARRPVSVGDERVTHVPLDVTDRRQIEDAVVNVVSLAALAAVPVTPAGSVSKAAALLDLLRGDGADLAPEYLLSAAGLQPLRGPAA
jgi:NAD(P)-dependent dehydrogenase (short-subunit alcohol dehydrogenase family)